MTPEDYIQYVEDYGCIYHRFNHADPHHFPQTRRRTDADWKIIPLCRICHSQYHNDPFLFFKMKGDKIIRFFMKQLPDIAPFKALERDLLIYLQDEPGEFWASKNSIFDRLYRLIVEE